MRPIPRLLALTDDRVAALENLGVRAAAIAANGPGVALVARLPHGTADRLAMLAQRFVALATPPMASVLVTGRADIALAVRAQGVILRQGDLPVSAVRAPDVPAHGHADGSLGWPADAWIIRSVHTAAEAEAAAGDGVDAIIVGMIWASETHADRAPAGTALLRQVVGTRLPVYAVGGVTPVRAREAIDAGAWGVAAIRNVWDTERPYDAARAMLQSMES